MGRYNPDDWKCYQTLRQSETTPMALFYTDGASNKYFSKSDQGDKDDDIIKILSPTKTLVNTAIEQDDYNISSYVILYCIQGLKILFCGDASKQTIEHLIAHHSDENDKYNIRNVDILVVPHHGRKDGFDDFGYLDLICPKYAIVQSVGGEFISHDEYQKDNITPLALDTAYNIAIQINNGELSIAVGNKGFAAVSASKAGKQMARKAFFLPFEAWWITK